MKKTGLPIALIVLLLVGGLTIFGRTASITELGGLAVAQSSSLWNNLKDAAQGDGLSNGVAAMGMYGYDGAVMNRWRCAITTGCQVNVVAFNGGVAPGDAVANPTNAINTFSLSGLWDSTNSQWNRERSVSSVSNIAGTSNGVAYSAPLSTWFVTNTPALATQATVSNGAGGGTLRHVVQSVTLCVSANATAQTPLLFHLRDGATGAGVILRTWALSVPVTTSRCENLTGLNITGSANTATTLESAAAPVAGAQATVSMTGYNTP